MSKQNLPYGTRDEFGPVTEGKIRLAQLIQTRFNQQGFHPIKTPMLEYRTVFSAMAPTADNAYQFLEDSGEALVLRPDLTLPIARVMSTTGITPPIKWCYTGDIFRIQRRHSGGYNQITQAGVEIIGYKSLKAEWECLSLAAGICRELELTGVTLELGDAGFVATVLAALPEANRAGLKQALYAKNLTAYQAQLAQLPESALTPFMQQWPWLFGPAAAVLAQLPALPELGERVANLQQTVAFLEANYPELTVTLDLTSPSPQPYYTGLSFRAHCSEAADYLFSGGRYDRLLASFQQTRQPAVGFSFDLDALAASLAPLPTPAPVLIYFALDQWQAASMLAAETPGASLCLTDTRSQAQHQALALGAKLIDLTKEGA